MLAEKGETKSFPLKIFKIMMVFYWKEHTLASRSTWGHMSVIPALGRLRWRNFEFEVFKSYTVRPCLKIMVIKILKE